MDGRGKLYVAVYGWASPLCLHSDGGRSAPASSELGTSTSTSESESAGLLFSFLNEMQ